MSNKTYRVGFTTTVEQFVEVTLDTEGLSELEIEEAALDEAYDNLDGVPFLGWNWDEGSDWTFDDDYGVQEVDEVD